MTSSNSSRTSVTWNMNNWVLNTRTGRNSQIKLHSICKWNSRKKVIWEVIREIVMQKNSSKFHLRSPLHWLVEDSASSGKVKLTFTSMTWTQSQDTNSKRRCSVNWREPTSSFHKFYRTPDCKNYWSIFRITIPLISTSKMFLLPKTWIKSIFQTSITTKGKHSLLAWRPFSLLWVTKAIWNISADSNSAYS